MNNVLEVRKICGSLTFIDQNLSLNASVNFDLPMVSIPDSGTGVFKPSVVSTLQPTFPENLPAVCSNVGKGNGNSWLLVWSEVSSRQRYLSLQEKVTDRHTLSPSVKGDAPA